MDKEISKFIFSCFEKSLKVYKKNFQNFANSKVKKIKTKKDENIQYNFDVVIDEIFKREIIKFKLSGKIFSEESGFFEFGKQKYRIVYDPFCNSSLAARTFMDAAVGISVFSFDYKFITSAIMDYQTGIVGIVENNKTNFYNIFTREKLLFPFKPCQKLEDAWVVITLENRKERISLKKSLKILDKAKRIIISSGHIYWLRLATGAIDAYLDPFGGEKLYEMFACSVAQKNGCTVTDLKGKLFNPEKYYRIFETDHDFIYFPVAARNKKLHKEILKNINVK